MLLLIRGVLGDSSPTPPSGWTSIDSHALTSVGQTDMQLYYRVASSEPADYAVSNNGQASALNQFVAQIFAWSAATFETSAKYAAGSGSTTIPCPTVTSGGADRTLICVYGQYGCNQQVTSYTEPAGMTERVDANYTVAVGPYYTGFGIADKAISSSGATGTQNATASSSTPWHLAVSVLIQSSGGGSAALAGAAAGVATATGTMTHGVPLAGAAQGQASASGTLLPDVPGFAFDTDTDCILGEIVGALTGIARETTGISYIVRAYDVATGALVEESGTLTTDSNGRLPRWQDATLAAATFYQLMFVRVSDGAIGCKLMETS